MENLIFHSTVNGVRCVMQMFLHGCQSPLLTENRIPLGQNSNLISCLWGCPARRDDGK